jgi:hypothetical protein
MSDEDDIVSALGLAEAPRPKSGQTIQKVDPTGDVASLRGKIGRSAAEILGLPDAMRALRGQMDPDEAQHFVLTAAMGLIPGAKIENALMRGASTLASKESDNLLSQSVQSKMADYFSSLHKAVAEKANALGLGHDYAPSTSDISDEAIAKKLASDPGASIFDVAGTHVGGASSPFSSTNKYGNTIYNMPESTFPREVPFAPPANAQQLGFSIPVVHGTSEGLHNWSTPSGDAATGDALKLPEDELGVHFGSPRAAAQFSGNILTDYKAPRAYPTVLQTGNSLELPDLGTWFPHKVTKALAQYNEMGKATGTDGISAVDQSLKGKFPQSELDQLEDIGDVRSYLQSKGYDSVKYTNAVEDPGHTSYIMFKPSPDAPDYASGVRSIFAKFDPSKLSRPELAAGLGGLSATGAGTGLLFDENDNPIVQTK